MLRRFIVGLVGFLVLAALVVTPASAQTESAMVSGQITDATGRVVPEADVKIMNVATGVATTVSTNKEGIYSVSGLIPGRYRITVQKPGFREVIVDGLTLNVQDVVAQNVHLQIGSVSESVTVKANELRINTTDASVSTVIDRQFVENMPLNGRSFQSLLTLAPGVAVVPVAGPNVPSGGITVNGQRTEANYFTVDGVSLTPPKQTYIVWIQTKDGQPENQGQLRVNDKLEGSLESNSPRQQFDIFITAEDNPAIPSPTGPSLLRATVAP
jgi:hypothetical protein